MSGVREHPRASLSHTAQIKVDGRLVPVRVVDISETGIRLELDPSLGTSIRYFEIYWVPVVGSSPLILEGERVWSAGTIYGIRLRNTPPKLLHVIRSFVRFHRQEVDPTRS